MRPRPEKPSAVGPLKGLLAASLAVPALLLAAYAGLTFQSAFATARLQLQRTAELAREHARKVLEAQDQVAERTSDLVRGLTEAQIRAAEPALHAAMARIIAQLPDVSSVMLIDPAGRPLLSSSLLPVPATLDFSGADYVRGAADGADGTFIGRVRPGAVSNKPFLPMAHAATGANGAPEGVVVVGVLPRVFQGFYAAMASRAGSGEQDVVWLARNDGSTILRYPPRPPALPPINLNVTLPAHIKANPEAGFYTAGAAIRSGSGKGLFAYERVPGYALYVVAGRTAAAVTADWALALAGPLAAGIPAALVLFLVTLIALQRTRQKEAALAQAETEMRRRERVEAALLQRQRLDAIGQMTGGVAHDFNNLLMVIIGNLERLQKRAEDPAAVRRAAANALLGARRGAEIVQKLLTFSRRRFVRPEVLDLNRRLAEFKPLIDQAAGGVLVELELSAARPLAELDEGQFESAILNLVANARDAMAGEGRIVIATAEAAVTAEARTDLPPGAYVRVAVSDNGPGMDAATAARAFEPFFTTKDVGAGTGLGLSQVYGFAQQAGGTAHILSRPGAGVTVELLLPACADRAAAEPAAAGPTPRGEGAVVLVVDDDAAVRELTAETLRDLGWRTITAESAEAALAHLRGAGRIDLMFSDVVMPGGMNGLQLSTEARRLRPGLKVLLTSGYAAPALNGALPANVVLIGKPYTQEQLARHLHALSGERWLRVAE